jgi:hypothetical protein
MQPGGTSLGRALKIRSMVTMAGEVLPFVWPMRNFIHHNPLHGFEHLPFEAAVEQASVLFRAQGYLRRTDYQALLREGRIDPAVIDELIAEFLRARTPDRGEPDRAVADGSALDLHHILVTLMTRMDQPSVGNAFPSTDAILAQLRALAEAP